MRKCLRERTISGERDVSQWHQSCFPASFCVAYLSRFCKKRHGFLSAGYRENTALLFQELKRAWKSPEDKRALRPFVLGNNAYRPEKIVQVSLRFPDYPP